MSKRYLIKVDGDTMALIDGDYFSIDDYGILSIYKFIAGLNRTSGYEKTAVFKTWVSIVEEKTNLE